VEPPLPAERHERIQEVLRARQAVRVSTLSELLGVSEITVRRDLEALEQRGLLERTHGGAMSTRRLSVEPRYDDSISANASLKRQIGRAAAELVHPGDTVFLNDGTTTMEVYRSLQASDLKIVTNHVGMAGEKSRTDLELILVGGHVRTLSNSLVGPFAMESLRRVHASKAFVGVEGISLRYGVTTPSAAEAEIARTMIERTRGEVIIVADHSKLGTVADFVVAEFDHFDKLVIDEGISKEYRDGLAERGLEVVLASP
jgi:DeoR family transcriptional regulator, fructose operon transcriptional repressor